MEIKLPGHSCKIKLLCFLRKVMFVLGQFQCSGFKKKYKMSIAIIKKSHYLGIFIVNKVLLVYAQVFFCKQYKLMCNECEKNVFVRQHTL